MVVLPPDDTPFVHALKSPKVGGVVLSQATVAEAPPSTGIQDIMAYNQALNQQAAEIEILGVPVTVVIPKARNMEGYEPELNKNRDNYVYVTSNATVDLQPRRSVFYKYNWVPEDADELVALTFHPSFAVFSDVFVRTTVAGNPSPYGDLLFKVVRVFDNGKFQVLSRTAFGKPMVDQQVWSMLFPEEKNV